jgi:uncharacterized membrane protein YfcA
VIAVAQPGRYTPPEAKARKCRPLGTFPAINDEVDLSIWIVLLVAAFMTSSLSAVIGMGGGMTLLAIMATVLPPASIVPLHGVVQLCSNSSRVLVFLKHVRWKIFFVYTTLLIPAAFIASQVLGAMKFGQLKPLIGIWILVFLVWRRKKPTLRQPPLWVYAPLGLATGFISVFVGATGPFLAPFFLRDDFNKEEIIATKAVCQAAVHLFKIPVFMSVGFDFSAELPFLASMVVAVVLGSLLGKRLLRQLSQAVFMKVFEAVLGSIAIYLIVNTWWL